MAIPFHSQNLRYSGSYDNVLTDEKEIDAWEAQIQATLETIAKTHTGQALLAAIRQCHRITLIMPDPGAEEINADSTSTRPETEGYAAGTNLRVNPHAAATGGSAGSCTLLHFSPRKFAKAKGAGVSLDSVLCHELCHSLHSMMGRSMAGFELGSGYDDLDEFWAILVANIYLSEKHQPLRKNHADSQPLEPRLCDSKAFLAYASHPVRDVCLSAPGFTRALAHVPARFNPIRQYYAGKQS